MNTFLMDKETQYRIKKQENGTIIKWCQIQDIVHQ